LEHIVEVVLRQFSARCAFHGCAIAKIAHADLPTVCCDPIRIERVLYNVIDNAIRYAVDYEQQRETPEGAQVIVRLYAEDDTVYCDVSDNGPGIDTEHLSRLGARGQRLVQDVRRVEGSGLGLDYCFRILALSGGGLLMASDGPGRGTSVTVRLPTFQANIMAPELSAETMLFVDM
jgi:signal transduction histidine kinase